MPTPFLVIALVISILSVIKIVHSIAYIKLDTTVAHYTIPVAKFRSKKTGIQINIAKTNGPLVKGYLTLATEPHDDNGLPHALEHLVFLGSEDYPYNGALELIANRLYADGTNAWTTVDHTAFTTSHAGKDGFFKLLPIYMEHLLYPQLSDYSFKTEVYHINGEGFDGGVIYSEMEGADSLSDRLYDKLMKGLYPNHGYSACTGGALKNLRENTTNELVRAFHEKMYQPENLCITVCGDVTIDEIMMSIKNIETKIQSKPKQSKFVKPWQNPVPLPETTAVKILYPSKDDGFGQIYIGWHGPNSVTEFRNLVACSVLLDYLCSSPLKRVFVEKERLASFVSKGIDESSRSNLYIKFDNVPAEKVDLVHPKLQKLLTNIANGVDSIHMKRINDIILSKILKFMSDLEKSPHETIAMLLIKDFLYGSSTDDFKNIVNVKDQLEYLLTAPEPYWTEILKKYFVDKKHAESIGVLSKDELARSTKEESERITKRKEKLGPEGLKKMGDELAEAIKINSRSIPYTVLESVPIPEANNIKYYDVKTYRTDNTTGQPSALDLESWPIYAEAYDFRINFVYMTATLSTGSVDATLRPYLQLFLKLIISSPIRHGDILISYEDVIPRIRVDTVHIHTQLGLSNVANTFSTGSYSETATFTLQVEMHKYEKGAHLLIDSLLNSEFVVERIKSVGTQLLNSVSASMNDGKAAAMDLLKIRYYKLDSNVKTNSMMYQQKFLTSLLTKLKNKHTSQGVVDDLNELRKCLLTPPNLAVHIAADWSALSLLKVDLNAPWRQGFKSGPKRLIIQPDWKIMITPTTESYQGEVIGLAATSSAFLNHATPALHDFNDNNLAALIVALKYCTQTGGPMWRRLRGAGYTYGFRLYLSINEGLIYYTLYRASDLVKAYGESVNVINDLLRSNVTWEQTLVNSAKGAAVYELVNRISMIGNLQLQLLITSFRKVSADYNQRLVEKITEVTIDDMKRVAQLYMSKIFSPTQSKTVVVCNVAEAEGIAEGIAEGLKKYGLNLPVRQSWE